MVKKRIKSKCSECPRVVNFKNLRFFEGKLLCYKCWRSLKKERFIPNSRPGKSIEQVLKKTYTARVYGKRNNGKPKAVIFSLPQCMIGKKFKIYLVK